MSLNLTIAALALGIGYVVGSLPFGYLVAKSKGVDIFKVGSRSPGATNVKRSVGAAAGNLVFVLDFFKGLLAAGWVMFLDTEPSAATAYGLMGVFAAVVGHSFSLFTGFRGGKGVAAMLGGVTALMPWAAVVGALVWLAVFYSTRYVSLSSILMAFSLPLTNWLLGEPGLLVVVSLALALIVLVRHKENIARLARGQENRFERKEKVSVLKGKGKGKGKAK